MVTAAGAATTAATAARRHHWRPTTARGDYAVGNQGKHPLVGFFAAGRAFTGLVCMLRRAQAFKGRFAGGAEIFVEWHRVCS